VYTTRPYSGVLLHPGPEHSACTQPARNHRVPPGLRESREELQATFKSALQAGLAKLNLVTREEFEVQRGVLLKTREKLDALETAVRELEGRGKAE